MQVVSHQQLVKDTAKCPKITFLVTYCILDHFWAHVELSTHKIRSSAFVRFEKNWHFAQINA